MAASYKAILNVSNTSKVIEAASPAALGTAIGAAIAAEPNANVDVMYEVTGPVSRRSNNHN